MTVFSECRGFIGLFLNIRKGRKFYNGKIAAFLARLDPTLEELGDVKTAVSEAVTNAIIHGYDGKPGKVKIHSWIEENTIWIEVADQGVGIGDVNRAMEPLFTTRPEMERSGMGFTIMESFTDHFSVESEVGKGTVITLYKIFRSVGAAEDGGDHLCESTTTLP